jgi:hypothetical protein
MRKKNFIPLSVLSVERNAKFRLGPRELDRCIVKAVF